MKIKRLKQTEYEAKTLEVKAAVMYWEDSKINGIEDTEDGDNVPCKVGDCWCPIIDIDSGIITNWAKGVEAKINYKVCDEFSYVLKDINGEIICSESDNYVPSTMAIRENGYGDYIILDIDFNGKIDNWEFKEKDFEEELDK